MDRRQFLGSILAGGAATSLAGRHARAEAPAPIDTSARIVIIGAGAAGTAMANRLTRRLNGATITLIDPRRAHYYQPGLTLVAAGLKPASYVVSDTAEWLPDGVTWLPDSVAEIDPEARTVATEGGETVPYDWLIVASGLVLDHDAIEGFSLDMVGENGLGALYAGPDAAARTWAAAGRFTEEGGRAIFTRPATEMKCAGAPLKHAFLIDDIAARAGTRAKSEMLYVAPQQSLFSVPIVGEKVRMLFADRGIGTQFGQTLTAIDAGARRATFVAADGGSVEMDYDYLHVIPPQRAPEFVRRSGLSWPDRWRDQGWMEVDPETLRHRRYPDIFAVGDVAGVPKGKTAASVKWQVPVVEDHVVADIAGRSGTQAYNGYTSCPLITRVGRAMLVEFDYHNNLTPSFPGVIAPLEELWISWLMKEVALKATYNAMLRGLA